MYLSQQAASDQSRDTDDSYYPYGTVHLLYGRERDMDSLHYNCGRLGCTRGLLHVFCKNDKERIGEGSHENKERLKCMTSSVCQREAPVFFLKDFCKAALITETAVYSYIRNRKTSLCQ